MKQHPLLAVAGRIAPASMIRGYRAMIERIADGAGFGFAFRDFRDCNASDRRREQWRRDANGDVAALMRITASITLLTPASSTRLRIRAAVVISDMPPWWSGDG